MAENEQLPQSGFREHRAYPSVLVLSIAFVIIVLCAGGVILGDILGYSPFNSSFFQLSFNILIFIGFVLLGIGLIMREGRQGGISEDRTNKLLRLIIGSAIGMICGFLVVVTWANFQPQPNGWDLAGGVVGLFFWTLLGGIIGMALAYPRKKKTN